MKKVIYVAGRYSDGDTLPREEQEKNRLVMQSCTLLLWEKGYACINPIENDHFGWVEGSVDYEMILSCDFAIMLKVDAVFFCPGWEEAPDDSGVKRELRFAQEHSIPILTLEDIDE